MSDQLNNALADILIKATKTAESAQEFVMAEMPEVAEQVLSWNLYLNLIGLAVGVAFLILAIMFFVGLRKLPKEDDKEVPLFFASLACLIIFFALGSAYYHSFQILIAPKLYLIEYAAGLVK